MGAVVDRSSLELGDLKSYAYIPDDVTADDTILTLALEAAKEAADDYCNNPFKDADGNTEAIPSIVEMGVLAFASFEADRLSPGIASKRTDLLAESYHSVDEATDALRSKYWGAHRLSPGL